MKCEIPDQIERAGTWVHWVCSKCGAKVGSEVYDEIGAYMCQKCMTPHAFCIPPDSSIAYEKYENYQFTNFCRKNNLFSFEGYQEYHNIKLPEEMRKFFK